MLSKQYEKCTKYNFILRLLQYCISTDFHHKYQDWVFVHTEKLYISLGEYK